MTPSHGKNDVCLVLDIASVGDALRQGVYREPEASSAVRQVETVRIYAGELASRSAAIHEELNSLARRPTSDDSGAGSLRTLGAALWDSLLGPSVKKRLLSETAPDDAGSAACLTLLIDESLVSVPWELLYDGAAFLCQRFAVGRIVRTARGTAAPLRRAVGETVSMLVMANPTGDLPGTVRELEDIRAALRVFGPSIKIRAKASQVRREFVMAELRNHDVVHYSGHARFDSESPGNSGWILSDGLLTAQDVLQLTGSQQAMPALVFANACASGHAGAGETQLSLFSLSNAFLLAGVDHFIGTVGEIPDEAAAEMASQFYRALFQGQGVGESLRLARKSVERRSASMLPGGLSFVLYGDPRQSLRAVCESRQQPEEIKTRATVRCAACQKEILSRLKDASAPCVVCGLPICQKCRAKGVLACSSHETRQEDRESAPTPDRPVETANQAHGPTTETGNGERLCGRCGHTIPRAARNVAVCQEPGCSAPICERCARWLDRRYCKDHDIPIDERLRRAKKAREANEIPVLLERRAACQRETVYYEEVRNRLKRGPTVSLAGEKYSLVASSLKESSQEQELRRLLEHVSFGEKIEADCPRNRGIETQWRRRTLVGSRDAVRLRLRILSDLEKQAYPGFEDVVRGLGPVRERSDAMARESLDADAFLIEVLASTTGWNDEARGWIRGEHGPGSGSESRAESRWALALVDLESDEIIASPAHSRFAELFELLRPSPRDSTATAIESYIRENLIRGEFLTELELADRFRTSTKQIRSVFRSLSLSREYEEREIPDIGLALSRKDDL